MTNAYPATPPRTNEDRTLAIVVYVLLMAGMLTSGITSLVGVILAYVRKPGAPPLEQSHYRFAITSFWIGFIGTIIGFISFLGTFVVMFAGGWMTTQSPNGTPPPPPPPEFFWSFAPMILGWLLIFGSHIWALVRAIYGLIKLTSDKPMGHATS